MIDTSIDSYQDIIDVRDIIQRIEDLEETSNGSVANGVDGAEYEEDHEEYAELSALLADMRGYGGDEQWRGDWYPLTLIRDSHFTEYAEQLAEDIGAVTENAAWPNSYIDWERAARELQMDYASVDYNGTTYWYR